MGARVTEAIARVMFPLAVIVAVALWAKGYDDVGEGFSAGAVAGLGAIVQYVCLDHDHARRVVGARRVWLFVGIGLVGALTVVLAPVLVGAPPASHWPPPGAAVVKLGMLKLHTALLFDLAIAFLVYGALVGTFDRLFPPLEGDEQ